MKRFKLLITLLISVLIISGCASGGKDKPKKDNWEDFQKDKKVVIGFDNTFVPMGFQDKSGKNVYLVITKDSIIYHLTEGVTDKKTIANLSLNNNNKDWEAFIDKIDLEDFEKGKPSEELIIEDIPTTKIIIKTDKKEYSKTNIQNNKTWDYITKQIIDIKYSQLYNHLNLEK